MKNSRSFVLVLLIATSSLNHGEQIKTPNKRCVGFVSYPRTGRSSGTGFTRMDRASGLMAFPRVGRSDASDYGLLIDINSEDMLDLKRQGLIPYPRVGRSHDAPSPSYGNEVVKVGKVKRGEAVPGGMWFGPRLGRLHRRGDDQQSDDQQWEVFPLRDLSSPGTQPETLVPRSGHESDSGDDGQSTLNNGAAVY